MAGWVKVVLLLLGTSAVAGLVAVVGLPSLSPKVEPPPLVSAAPAPVPPTAPKTEPGTVPVAPPAPAVADQAAPPVFDVVRVEPTGDAVVAGRAIPGALVELLRNGIPHDRSMADAGGQFAMVPPSLSPGTHDLSLVQTLKDGRRIASVQSVTVSVPDKRTGEVVVALASPNRPTQLLTPPPAVPAAPAPQAAPGTAPVRPGVAVLSVEAEDTGRLYATGSAAPEAHVRLYLNDTYLATATASPDGRWSFTIQRGVAPGNYRVRADDVELASGRVLSRAEVPFEFARRAVVALAAPATSPPPAGGAVAPGPLQQAAPVPPASPPVVAMPTPPGAAPVKRGPASNPPADAVVAEIRTASVTRGDSLWRISKRIYGDGQRYTVIYTANAPQIREPNLIYPGQVFVLPTEQQP
ncbi:MAG: LysM peptidoglycan-binding domain-containing protein [Alsobacter sp.]